MKIGKCLFVKSPAAAAISIRGLTSNGRPMEHFTVAGPDGKFIPANAGIDGDTIIVSNAFVDHPTAVHYAWADDDESSFGNKQGLPASSFRTDEPIAVSQTTH